MNTFYKFEFYSLSIVLEDPSFQAVFFLSFYKHMVDMRLRFLMKGRIRVEAS